MLVAEQNRGVPVPRREGVRASVGADVENGRYEIVAGAVAQRAETGKRVCFTARGDAGTVYHEEVIGGIRL